MNTSALPRLEVRIMIAFLKDTVRPWESVTRPSSRICRGEVFGGGVGGFRGELGHWGETGRLQQGRLQPKRVAATRRRA